MGELMTILSIYINSYRYLNDEDNAGASRADLDTATKVKINL